MQIRQVWVEIPHAPSQFRRWALWVRIPQRFLM